MDCKRALQQADGDMENAVLVLKKQGAIGAEKRVDRQVPEGAIFSYIHTGCRIGVLLLLRCETDFVAKNSEFQTLGRDLCLHIAAANPSYVSAADIPADELQREREVATGQLAGKPAHAVEAMIQGKLAKYAAGVCLLQQPFVKNPSMTVEELLREYVARIGENIRVGRFARFQVGG
jgi:elongation factor Ts